MTISPHVPKLANPFTDPDDEICGKGTGPDYEQVMCYYEKHPITVPHYDKYIGIYWWTEEELLKMVEKG
jgi:hypothetical protein